HALLVAGRHRRLAGRRALAGLHAVPAGDGRLRAAPGAARQPLVDRRAGVVRAGDGGLPGARAVVVAGRADGDGPAVERVDAGHRGRRHPGPRAVATGVLVRRARQAHRRRCRDRAGRGAQAVRLAGGAGTARARRAARVLGPFCASRDRHSGAGPGARAGPFRGCLRRERDPLPGWRWAGHQPGPVAAARSPDRGVGAGWARDRPRPAGGVGVGNRGVAGAAAAAGRCRRGAGERGRPDGGDHAQPDDQVRVLLVSGRVRGDLVCGAPNRADGILRGRVRLGLAGCPQWAYTGDVTYTDRRAAGAILAERLSAYAGPSADEVDRSSALVLGLVRGGVPVAAAIADALRLPLDALVVRKLGVPWAPEVAFGALGQTGVQVLNEQVSSRLTPAEIEMVLRQEAAELVRREQIFRSDRPPLDLTGHDALVIDDGLATGATARAAVEVARRLGA